MTSILLSEAERIITVNALRLHKTYLLNEKVSSDVIKLIDGLVNRLIFWQFEREENESRWCIRPLDHLNWDYSSLDYFESEQLCEDACRDAKMTQADDGTWHDEFGNGWEVVEFIQS